MSVLKIAAAFGLLIVVCPFLIVGLAAEAIVRACSFVFDLCYDEAMRLLGMPASSDAGSGW